jgi:pimeloyl-ACP methyl ester carboxylesterase
MLTLKESLLLSVFLISGACACSSDDGDGEGSKEGAESCDDSAGTAAEAPPDEVMLPIVFVHGFAGSAQQYQSQAMRFVANGYPQERISAFEHDGEGFDTAGYVAGLDAWIDDVLAEFGTDQVYLVGHSRGTLVSTTYVSNAARAAKIAKYIALDGSPCPSAVPCVAPNQAGLPGQAHVEVATSKESFMRQWEFLIGSPPTVTEIVPQCGSVTVSGRAVNFPANTGRAGATLEVWEINADTGMRVKDAPLATFTIGDDGNWGPVTLDPNKLYEKALVLPDSGSQHFYPQRFPRDTHFARLLTGPPDSPTRLNTNRGPNHAAVIALRMREWYGTDDADNPADESDILEVSTASAAGDQPVINAVTPRLENGSIAIHIHDDVATPGESTLGDLPNLTGPFQVTSDVFMPAADPPNGTITFKNLPRGDASRPQVVNFPNWASEGHIVMVMFTDYPLD